MRLVPVVLAWLFLVVAAQPSHSHALEPGYLEMHPVGEGQWRVTWRVPQVGTGPMPIEAVLPAACEPRRAPVPRFDGGAYVAGWIATCQGPIDGAPLVIDGLGRTRTDVLLRYTPEPGRSAQTFRLTPDAAAVVLPGVQSGWAVSGSYFTLGVDHILGGIDHLLFVFALLLLIPDRRRLVLAITAFTVAHSLTLAMAALGLIALPMPPVEAVIALSIVFLAAEILHREEGGSGIMQRAPWVVAFAFGLLHGLGFASALREIGLPKGDIPLALVTFNLGVEAGQLLFVAAVVLAAWGAGALAPRLMARLTRPGAPAMGAAAYAIGGVAAFWTIERVLGIVA
jgi:hydrogenase/urease accessory protein HupE